MLPSENQFRRIPRPCISANTASRGRSLLRDGVEASTGTAHRALQGRIYIDYLRNDRNSTAIAPYSTRARPGAPVAVPLAWAELAEHESTPVWTVQTIADRLAQPDPWAGIGDARQSITKAQKRAVGL